MLPTTNLLGALRCLKNSADKLLEIFFIVFPTQIRFDMSCRFSPYSVCFLGKIRKKCHFILLKFPREGVKCKFSL